MTYSLYEMLILFFVYAFLGWCAEVVFAAVNHGIFVNRGFLFGPVCPIYGIGVVAVIQILNPIKDNILLLFVLSVLITTLIELLVGIAAKKLLNERLWDYSENPFNYKGYICLKFSLMWGIGCMAVIKIIHPVIYALLSKIPNFVGIIMITVFSILIVIDFILTGTEALKIPKKSRAADEIERAISVISDEIGGGLYEGVNFIKDKKNTIEPLIEKYKKLFSESNFTQRRLLKAFPNLQSKYKDKFEKIKMFYTERRQSNK